MTIKNYSDLKNNNIRNILISLLQQGPLSRSKLSSITGLTPSALTALCRGLLEDGFIKEISSQNNNSGAGRPPTLLTLRNQTHVAFGVEIGATFVKMAIIGLAGEPLLISEHNFEKKVVPEATFQLILQFVSKHTEKLEQKGVNVTGLGLSIPGLINIKENLVRFSPNLNWKNVSVSDFFADKLKIPIILDNNVNFMTIGEKWFGHGKKADSLAYIHFGTGVGFGTILPNLGLLRGHLNGAGELGHCTILADGPICSCGKKGCLEAVISKKYLVSKYLSSQKKTVSKDIDINKLVQLAENGDILANEILIEAINYLGLGISHIYNLFEPEIIVLSGNKLLTSSYTIDLLEKATEKHCFSNDTVINFIHNSFKDDQAVIGAAAEVFKEILL